MKGGAYVVDGETRDPTDIILNLMYNESVVIKLISGSSRNGVVIEINIPHGLSPFRDIDDAGHEYPIVRIICKFVLVNDKVNRSVSYNVNEDETEKLRRETVKYKDLKDEAINLSKLYNLSFQIKPICPAPLAYGTLDGETVELLLFLANKVVGDVRLLNLLIKGISYESTKLGYLCMSHAEQNMNLETRTLYGMYNYLKSTSDTDAQNEMMAEVYFIFAILLFLNGIMNCDPHSDNILVTMESRSPPKFKCLIIDVQQTRDITEDGYFRLVEEHNKLLRYKTKNNKIGFMKKIIEEFVSISTKYRKENYGINNSGANWIEWYSEAEQNDQLIKAADKFLKFNAVPRYLPPKTIWFTPLPPGSTRSKRPVDLEESEESEESEKKKRRRGGKLKRTRRAKPKKKRTIKRRNALKR